MNFLIMTCLSVGIGLCIIGLAESWRHKIGRWRSAVIIGFGYVFIVSSVCFIGMLSFFSALGDFEGMCADEILSESTSPDGQTLVYIYSRDCGATTSFGEMAPTIMLRDRSHPVQFEDRHILARTDWLGQNVDDVIYKGGLSGIKWLSNTHLQIESASELTGDSSWDGISYKTAPKVNRSPSD